MATDNALQRIKKWIKMSQENYYTLKTTGTVEIDGVTYTYSPEDTIYVTSDSRFTVVYTWNGNTWSCNYPFNVIKEAYNNSGQPIIAVVSSESVQYDQSVVYSLVYIDDDIVVYSACRAIENLEDQDTNIIIVSSISHTLEQGGTETIASSEVTVSDSGGGGTTYTAGTNIVINNDIISSPDKSYKIVNQLPQSDIDTETYYLTEKVVSDAVVPGVYDINIYRDSQWDTVGEVDLALLSLTDTVHTTDIVQSEGNNPDKIMSQKAVTESLLTKLEKPLTNVNVRANKTDQSDGIPVWVTNTNPDYSNYDYMVDLDCQGCTANMLAKVLFSDDQSRSGDYATTCITGTNIVTIFSNDNSSIVIPAIIYGLPINTILTEGHNYSTDEQVVGTWIDGRPIYEKTIEVTLTGDGTIQYSHNISDLDIIVNLFGNFSRGSDDLKFTFPYVSNNNTYLVLLEAYNSTKLYISCGGNMYNASPSPITITIQYTKTTDTTNG